MSWLRLLLLLVCCPLFTLACRDGGLEVPEQQRGDLGPGSDLADPTPCSGHADEKTCVADARCKAFSCPGCNGSVGFSCIPKGEPGPLCPAISCPEGCGLYGTQPSCDADPGCVSVYEDRGVCDCNEPGCCMGFSRCIDLPVQCSPSGIGPQCSELPWDCGKAYAPAFEGGCQIGCVRKDLCVDDGDCRLDGCAIGYQCDQCWAQWVCMPEGQGNAC
jgi:hypothetical protein